jgi:hypothetical protein
LYKHQYSAVNRAIELRGKLKGFLIDRVEIGQPGDFDGLTSPQAVVDRLLLEADDPAELVDLLRRMVTMAETRLSNMARPVGSSASSKVKPKSEAQEALALLRPEKR